MEPDAFPPGSPLPPCPRSPSAPPAALAADVGDLHRRARTGGRDRPAQQHGDRASRRSVAAVAAAAAAVALAVAAVSAVRRGEDSARRACRSRDLRARPERQVQPARGVGVMSLLTGAAAVAAALGHASEQDAVGGRPVRDARRQLVGRLRVGERQQAQGCAGSVVEQDRRVGVVVAQVRPDVPAEALDDDVARVLADAVVVSADAARLVAGAGRHASAALAARVGGRDLGGGQGAAEEQRGSQE